MSSGDISCPKVRSLDILLIACITSFSVLVKPLIKLPNPIFSKNVSKAILILLLVCVGSPVKFLEIIPKISATYSSLLIVTGKHS